MILYGDALWALERCQESDETAPSPLFVPNGSPAGKSNFLAEACATGTAGCLPAYSKEVILMQTIHLNEFAYNLPLYIG
ncbi:MAG: hypothetical protein JWM95_1894, partial [Gemmatimonadetes bacterium]|nr:hypothetical protein [Gemmatimonadota bacterium]